MSLKIFCHKSLSFMTLPSLQQPNKTASVFLEFAPSLGLLQQQQQQQQQLVNCGSRENFSIN